MTDQVTAPVAEAQQTVQEQTSAETAPEAKIAEPQVQKHKLKINGIEKEFTLDDVITRAQKFEAAEQKFQEAARIRKEIEAFERDPFGYLKAKGKDPYQAAEELLIEKLKWEEMPPEKKELEIERQKRLELERKFEEATKKEQEIMLAQAEAKAAQQLDDDISSALKSFELTPTPEIVAQVATLMLSHHEAGRQITATEAATKVLGGLKTSFQKYLEQLPHEKLLEVLPKKVLDGLRKAQVEKVLSQDPVRSRRQSQTEPTESQSRQPKQVSTDDYFKKLDQKFSQRR